ncbi:MAG: FAD-dependent oxidoreductase [Alphaproteobacteria bacterium]|nr:FAD-dependent oxidoreductase [Alphaproteobacteria bacterium]
MSDSFDVAIAGGAAVGASIAYHLAADPDFRGRILVLEPDPAYARAASALSAASIRQQFSSAVNIRVSLYGIGFLRAIGERLAVDGERPDIGLREGGYLFLATAAGAGILAENHALQSAMGADIAHFDAAGLKAQFPWLAVDDLAAGTWGRTGEGWFDGYGLMQAFRRKARSLGVEFRKAALSSFALRAGRAGDLALDDGSRVSCGQLVIAAGTGARALVRQAGFDIPVHAKKRMIFTFECREKLDRFPLLIDPGGVYCRPEGTGFICGSAPPPEADPDATDFEVEHGFFDEVVWPALATRIPAFEAIRPGRAWAGHYDMNLFDHNALVGPVPGTANVYLANGFSGHGLQQSPAVGRYLADLILRGRAGEIDMAELDPGRIAANRPVVEKNVV